MKLIILSFLLVFSGLSLAQAQNPQRHFCIITGGTFLALPLENDVPGFCFQGPAVIDSLSLMSVVTGGSRSSAVTALDNKQSCISAGGRLIFSTDSTFSSTALCKFNDHSFVGALSLGNHPNGFNDQLLQALSERY